MALQESSFSSSPADLVVTAAQLPDGSGIELCRTIRERPQIGDLPVIVVTASDRFCEVQVAFEAGAADFIVKPLRSMELLARVRSAVRLKREMDARRRREVELERTKKELQEANRELERLAVEDAVTGIANRRVFDSTFASEWSRALRHGSYLSLILIDVDHFKAYNDLYGHRHGDSVLAAVASVLKSCARRSSDTIARYGGEEFVAILPEVDLEDALRIAESMRRSVEQLSVPHDMSPTLSRITVSIGCASLEVSPDQSMEHLLEAADQALYQAKDSGRNRVCSLARGPDCGTAMEKVDSLGGSNSR